MRKGRILKISVRMKERLRLFASRHPFKSARELKNEVIGWGDISVHPSKGAQDPVASPRQNAAANRPHGKKTPAFLQEVQRMEGTQLEKRHVIHLQALKLQGGKGVEADQHLPLQAAVHGPHHEIFPWCNGLGML
jgi:hypothetical protein